MKHGWMKCRPILYISSMPRWHWPKINHTPDLVASKQKGRSERISHIPYKDDNEHDKENDDFIIIQPQKDDQHYHDCTDTDVKSAEGNTETNG